MPPGNRSISLISLPRYTISVCLMMQQVLVQNDHYHSVKKHACLIPITDEVQGSNLREEILPYMLKMTVHSGSAEGILHTYFIYLVAWSHPCAKCVPA